jgi:transforming growth factor-beta-induced protein
MLTMKMFPLGVALAAALLAPAQAQSQPRKNLVETAQAAGSFGTLLAAAAAADLAGTLSGEGPFTVFAPTDEAFAKLGSDTIQSLLLPENKDRLRTVLLHHVVAGRVDALTALGAKTAETLAGDTVSIRLEEGRLRIDDASVVQNDIQTSNGVIHVLDTVLVPAAPAPEIPTEPRAAARAALERAVELGAPRFNDGDPATCAELYELALVAIAGLGRELLAEETLEEVLLARREALQLEDPKRRAWRLRRGIDAVYLDLDRPVTTTSADKKAQPGLRPVAKTGAR